MGDDSSSRGHGFKSQCHILDGHLFTLISCKNCIVFLKRPKINEKEAVVGQFKKIIIQLNDCMMETSFCRRRWPVSMSTL